uniref:Uncharacterized protein n=1 Tax=Opuntia streptacantha TaxID=393608 RepID=A0A7C9E945_OPUST
MNSTNSELFFPSTKFISSQTYQMRLNSGQNRLTQYKYKNSCPSSVNFQVFWIQQILAIPSTNFSNNPPRPLPLQKQANGRLYMYNMFTIKVEKFTRFYFSNQTYCIAPPYILGNYQALQVILAF